MTTPVRAKRMARERRDLEQDNPDYFVVFKDDNLFDFDAYVFGPDDSLYRHKLVKLHIHIPENYPITPPDVTFIQHQGERIHPNLYVEGKVCLSILGTWAGEPWAFSMTVASVLITIRSLLDNEPYTHEPGQDDDPDFNQYVEYATWCWLLLDYAARETDPAAKARLQSHLRDRGAAMVLDLVCQRSDMSSCSLLHNPYTYGQPLQPDYAALARDLDAAIAEARLAAPAAGAPGPGAVASAERKETADEGAGSAAVLSPKKRKVAAGTEGGSTSATSPTKRKAAVGGESGSASMMLGELCAGEGSQHGAKRKKCVVDLTDV